MCIHSIELLCFCVSIRLQPVSCMSLAVIFDWVLIFHISTNMKILFVLDKAAIVPLYLIKKMKIIFPVSSLVVVITWSLSVMSPLSITWTQYPHGYDVKWCCCYGYRSSSHCWYQNISSVSDLRASSWDYEIQEHHYPSEYSGFNQGSTGFLASKEHMCLC